MNQKLQTTINWLLDRLSESSTWRGIVSVLTGLGAVIKPDKATAIITAGISIVGLINIFRQGAPTKSQVIEALATKTDKPGVGDTKLTPKP